MTMSKLIERLSKNATKFLHADEREKSNACMDLILFIRDKGFENIKGKIVIDNL